MAFTNLFTSLSPIDEDAKSPGEPRRNQSEGDEGSHTRKRKAQAGHRGPYEKKQHDQEQKTETYNPAWFEYDDFKATRSPTTDGEHAGVGFAAGRIPDQRGRRRGGARGVNQQRQERKKLHHLNDKWKSSDRRGRRPARHGSRRDDGVRPHTYENRDVHTKVTRMMTQEFKEQNALLVDGRPICRHHVFGRCTKGDDCQLEHVQAYNDLIRQVCKFYVQGFCMKGDSCPYMHKSFPCKHFHKKAKCFQGADCKFSHEPLNDLTARLLDEALKRERDLCELSNPAEPEPEESATPPGALTRLLRPSYYNAHAGQPSPCEPEEASVDVEGTRPHQTPPSGPPSADATPGGPVCYSVEAVLGRQHFRPFPSFTAAPQAREAASLSAPASGSGRHAEVPYSVEAFLRSRKAAENFPPPAAQNTACTSNTGGASDAPLRSGVEDENVSCPGSARDETVRFPVRQVPTSPPSGAASSPVLGDNGGRPVGSSPPPKPVRRVWRSPVSVAEKSPGSRGDASVSARSAPVPPGPTCPPGRTSEPRAACSNTGRLGDSAAGSFLGLFAAPLLPAPPPSRSQPRVPASRPVDAVSPSTDSKQGASGSEAPVRSDEGQTSRSTASPEARSLVGSPAAYAAPASSDMKSLFLSLSPFRQDGEKQMGVPAGSGKTRQQNEGEAGRRKKMETPQISSEATGGPTLCSAAVAEPQMRRSGKHNLPLKAVATPVPRHTLVKPKPTSKEGECANGNTVVTPLKDLFKTFDTTVFHCGH